MTAAKKRKKLRWYGRDWELFSMSMLGVVLLLAFSFVPMFGLILCFKQGDGALNISNVIFHGRWVGMTNFLKFFRDKNFWDVMWNTLGINLLGLAVNFPAPILFALLINEIRVTRYKKAVQFLTYLPHFLSWSVFGGIILSMINPDTGVLNSVLVNIGVIERPINFIGDPKYTWTILIGSGLLKGIGWGSIIYLASIAGIDPQLYEAAKLDGAGRMQLMRYITLPCMAQTVTLFLLLNLSGIMNNGAEQFLMFQNNNNLSRSEVIDTYVLKYGVQSMRYSFGTVVGLFKSVIGIILLLGSNFISKRLTGRGVI